MQDANVSYSHTLGHEADMKDVALVSGSADYTAKIWKVNADGKVCWSCIGGFRVVADVFG